MKLKIICDIPDKKIYQETILNYSDPELPEFILRVWKSMSLDKFYRIESINN